MAPKSRAGTPATTRTTVPSTPTSPTSSSTTRRPTSSSSGSGSAIADAQDIVQRIWQNYVDKTPQRTKLIDAFLAFIALVGALQFVYCILVGNFPFNAFLAGFSACVGQFVLTVSLRMQTNPENEGEFVTTSSERAFADYVFGSLLLHFFCINFIN